MPILLLSILLIITACNTGETIDSPKIDLKFHVSNLTDKQFRTIGTSGIESATKYDFKNIEFTLDIKHSNNITNRKIIIPNIKTIANSYDRERYWFGQSYSQDNSTDNFAKYGNTFMFYSKGLDEQTIKNIFNSAEVIVSWVTNSGENEERLFKLGDAIKFKSN